MRKLHTLAVMLIYSCNLVAQCIIPNADFEKWVDFSDTLGYEMDLILTESIEFPETWFPLERTVNIVLSDFFTPYLFEDTLDVAVFHTYEKMSPGLKSNHALMFYGDDSFELSDAYTSFSCSNKPQTLSFLTEYVGEESGLLQVYVLIGPQRLDFSTAYGYGQIFVESADVESLKKITLPIQYRSDDTPSRAVIQIKRVVMENMPADAGGYFAIDDLTFDANQNVVPLAMTPSDIQVEMSPNPAIVNSTEYISVDVDYKSVEIFDLSGKYIGQQQFSPKGIKVLGLPAGTYVARFRDNIISFSEVFLIQH